LAHGAREKVAKSLAIKKSSKAREENTIEKGQEVNDNCQKGNYFPFTPARVAMIKSGDQRKSDENRQILFC
jgi:hypothetical protein